MVLHNTSIIFSLSNDVTELRELAFLIFIPEAFLSNFSPESCNLTEDLVFVLSLSNQIAVSHLQLVTTASFHVIAIYHSRTNLPCNTTHSQPL